MFVFFFFSSRRRHTRCSRDWSSDVCSSDLLLKANSRRSDICGRIGGAEFLFILTHTTKENANVVIKRIRAALEGTKFDFAGGRLTVTARFRVAGFAGTHAAEFNRFVSPADAALHLAKRTRRNRI